MTARLYTPGKEGLLDGSIKLYSDTLAVHGVSSAYVFNAAHQFVSDLGATILDTTGVLGGKTFTAGVFTSGNPSFPFVVIGHTIDALVVFQDTGLAATSRLVSYTDESGDATLPWVGTGAPVVVNWGGQIFALADC